MRIKLEKRPAPSRLMVVVTPILSVIATMLVGVLVFDALGIDGIRAVTDIFISPSCSPISGRTWRPRPRR